jgi:hypothetical protein
VAKRWTQAALYEKLRAEKPSFVEAIKVPLAAVLASPHFLYLVEPARWMRSHGSSQPTNSLAAPVFPVVVDAG